MIICPDLKYVFIRPQRTGSTSMMYALSEHFTDNTILSGTAKGEPVNMDRMTGKVVDHSFGRIIQKHFPEDLNPEDFLWFTILRNPWARIHSFYKYISNQGAKMNFDDYIVSGTCLELHHWYNGIKGEVKIVMYPAYETVSHMLGLRMRVPKIIRTEASDYREAYPEQWMVDVIADRCAPEIELGKFKFEDGEDLEWRKECLQEDEYISYQSRMKDEANAAANN